MREKWSETSCSNTTMRKDKKEGEETDQMNRVWKMEEPKKRAEKIRRRP